MWFLHLRVREETNVFNEAATRHDTKLFVKPNAGFERGNAFVVQGTMHTASSDQAVHAYFSSHEKITFYESEGNYAFWRYHEELGEDRVHGLRYAYNPALVHVKPVLFTPDGWEEWRVASVDRDDVSKLIEASEELNVEFEVKALEEQIIPSVFSFPLADSLTEKQREVVSVARRVGYFDVPRDATIDDIAAELDVAQSTAHKHLQKAVRTILDQTHL